MMGHKTECAVVSDARLGAPVVQRDLEWTPEPAGATGTAPADHAHVGLV